MKLLWIPVIMVLTAAGFGYGRTYQFGQDKSYIHDTVEQQKTADDIDCKKEMEIAIRWLKQQQQRELELQRQENQE